MAGYGLRALTQLDPGQARTLLGCVRGVFAGADGLSPLETELLRAVGTGVLGLGGELPHPTSARQLAEAVADPRARAAAVELMVVLELTRHPLPEDVERCVARAAEELDVEAPVLEAARDYAHGHLERMHSDLARQSWYTEQVESSLFHGKLLRVLKSRVSYLRGIDAPLIAVRWQALRNCPEGSWGLAVAEFYDAHHFPFPGESHGIEEIGAHHDWVHVLAGYDATPEGELDVFAFIAAASDDPHCFTQLAITMALFQNGATTTAHGKQIAIARTDTLSDPGAADRFALAIGRGVACTVDAMALDHFLYKDEPLEEMRRRFNVLPV
jgi:hypothetical protein